MRNPLFWLFGSISLLLAGFSIFAGDNEYQQALAACGAAISAVIAVAEFNV